MLASVALVVSSPWIGDMRTGLRRAIPGQYVAAINTAVAVLALALVGLALARVRTGRARRYGLMALAVAVAAISAVATSSANASQNAVERFHFIEYGLVTWLFYRAVRDRPAASRAARPGDDLTLLVLPACAGLIVGTADEWFQWYVPNRVGELRDIFLNGWAIAAGLLMSLAASPPARMPLRLDRRARAAAGLAAAGGVIAVAAFIHTVHLGYRLSDERIGVFTSRYTPVELAVLARDRAERWRTTPPPAAPPAMSREDQYLAEGLWHVQARNVAWAVDLVASWHENQILETYFAPVITLPGYGWPAAQRADAAARVQALPAGAFVSRAGPQDHIFVWPKADFWTATMAAVALLLAAGFAGRRPATPARARP